jgi:hypothetical protein
VNYADNTAQWRHLAQRSSSLSLKCSTQNVQVFCFCAQSSHLLLHFLLYLSLMLDLNTSSLLTPPGSPAYCNVLNASSPLQQIHTVFLCGATEQCVSGLRNLIYRHLVGLLDQGLCPSHDLCLERTAQTHRKRRHTSMPKWDYNQRSQCWGGRSITCLKMARSLLAEAYHNISNSIYIMELPSEYDLRMSISLPLFALIKRSLFPLMKSSLLKNPNLADLGVSLKSVIK